MGDRLHNLSSATSLLSANDLSIKNESSVYETEAWGKQDQDSFLNQALKVSTSLSPLMLLERCLKIEEKLGRVRDQKWGPRIIDIDIAYYENLIINLKELNIPQKGLENRRFALTTLNELSSEKLHPVLLKTNEELLIDCSDSLNVTSFNV